METDRQTALLLFPGRRQDFPTGRTCLVVGDCRFPIIIIVWGQDTSPQTPQLVWEEQEGHSTVGGGNGLMMARPQLPGDDSGQAWGRQGADLA